MPFLEPIDNSTMTDLLVTTNAYSEGWLGLSLLLIIFFIMLWRMKDFPLEKSFASASFIIMLMAILLNIIGIVSGLFMGIAIVLALVSFVVLLISEKRTGF